MNQSINQSGPSCESVCQPAGLLAAELDMAMISYGCESTRLANETVYPTFSRTSGTFHAMGNFMDSIFHEFRWNKGVAFVTIVNSSNVWLEMTDELDVSE